ncbi:MAG: hypothetical protein KDC46_12670 [Thermoleophilia bacterium]|nr:hypothetical protein [Thermoleophilia bacterium]
MRTRYFRHFSCAALLFVLLMPVFSTTADAAVERKILGPNDEPSGLVIVSPFRIEEDVQPGVRKTIQMTLTNDSDKEVDITLTPTDLAASSNPRSFIQKVEDGEFGAGDWLVPEIIDDRLAPWEQIKFDLVIDPPTSAPVGTNMAGLSVDTALAEGEPGTGDQQTGVARAEALVQIFLTVPGPVEHKLRIVDVDVRDTLVLGSQRFVVWDITYRNDGTVNEHVEGTFDVRSIFGNSAHREPIESSLVLRGSTRTQRIVWRDLPWVGAFTPEVKVRGDDAKLISATGERVIVFPWWLPVIILLLVVAPAVWIWWRRRQEWKLYLDDEDWDDDYAFDDDQDAIRDN